MVFPKYKKVVFIHGCFWHGHENCKYFVVPKTRTEWWLNKINSNKKKDTESFYALNKKGWKVITIWECELKPNTKAKKLKSIIREFQNN